MSATDTAAELRRGITVAELQGLALRRYADRTALVAGDLRVSYAALQARVAQFARLFAAHGLKRGDGFAVLASNRLEVIYANLAGQVLGMRYTPLHPKGSEEDQLYILDFARISALLVDDRHFAERGRALAEKAALKALFTIDGSFGTPVAAADDLSSDPLAIVARRGDICYLVFTGGTSGRP